MVRVMSAAACAWLAASALASPARAESCAALWTQRNAIYKQAGYCFRTARAIRAFGNAGCQYDDIDEVPLSLSDRRTVDIIVGVERDQGCPS